MFEGTGKTSPTTSYHNATTASGYALDEVVSALQKCIRRGKEELAMFFAIEMVESGYVDYMWRRLIIVASEDIGIADPFCAVLVNSLRLNAEVARGRARKTELNDQLEPLQEAILYMCRAKKTRYGDDFLCYVNRKREQGWLPSIPDEAIDKHTRRGREIGRDDIFFCREGARVSNELEVDGKNYLDAYCELCGTAKECEVRDNKSRKG